MTRVLFIGFDPSTVDFSDPSLPSGMNAGAIEKGIEAALTQMRERGWEADFCSLRPEEDAVSLVRRRLVSAAYDCAVIGGGVRLPPRHLALFEALINAIREESPSTAIAFNTAPTNSAEAVDRVLR